MSPIRVERIAVPPRRARVIQDCVGLIDAQVKRKGGLGGIAVKGAYATVKAIKRGFVGSTVDAMLDDWLGKIQQHHDKWSAGGGGTFSEFLIARSDDVAEDLLLVTDERAATTKHTTARKAYVKMRGSAKKNVIEAIPELARMIERHLEECKDDPVPAEGDAAGKAEQAAAPADGGDAAAEGDAAQAAPAGAKAEPGSPVN